MSKPKIVIFECGCSEGGGLMSEKLIEAIKKDILNAEIVGLVSNYDNGGVRSKAEKNGIPFIHFPKPWTSENYQKIARESGADFFVLAGWFIPIMGLDTETKFNSKTVIGIIPGPISPSGEICFNGHKSVLESFKKNEITETEINMFFVDEKPNSLLVFAKVKIPINDDENHKTLGVRVKEYEYLYHPRTINLVVNGMISWDGINPNSLEIPPHYSIEQ